MDKYDLLACDTFLSHYDASLPSIEEVVENKDTIVWEPFENYTKEFLIEAISNLAKRMRAL